MWHKINQTIEAFGCGCCYCMINNQWTIPIFGTGVFLGLILVTVRDIEDKLNQQQKGEQTND